MVLVVRNLSVHYGPIRAVEDVSFALAPQTVLSIIGPNGAGKSSLLRAIMGLVRSRGDIQLDGQAVGGRRAHARARLGLSYVPDGRGVFPDLTVRDHIRVAAGRGWEERWEALVELFPVLGTKADARGSELSGGQQQAVSIARALAPGPKYILLDEPSMGLSPIAIESVIEAIERLSGTGVGVLLAEQNASLALALSERVDVMVRGTIQWSGSPAELRGTEILQGLYLGRAAAPEGTPAAADR